MNDMFSNGSVPVAVAARVYGKDATWIRAGIISGWLPIGKATRKGKLITNIDDMNSKYGRINFYISPKLLFEETGYVWKKAYYALDGLAKRPYDLMLFSQSNSNSSPTERCVLSREYFYSRMRLVEETCDATDSIIGQYILHAVTEGCSYEVLRTRYGIPCCKDIYYELYRKFFWILNKSRD